METGHCGQSGVSVHLAVMEVRRRGRGHVQIPGHNVEDWTVVNPPSNLPPVTLTSHVLYQVCIS